MSNIMIENLIHVKTQHLKDMDDVHPDVGMGMCWASARIQAIRALKKDKMIPENYADMPTPVVQKPVPLDWANIRRYDSRVENNFGDH